MIEILQNIIEAMQAEGYNVDAHYGPNWMIAFKSPNSDKVQFAFPPLVYESNPDAIERRYTFEWFCVARYQLNETDEQKNIAAMNEIAAINSGFILRLQNYTATTGIQPLHSFAAFRHRETFDTLTFAEPVIGIQSSTAFTSVITNQC